MEKRNFKIHPNMIYSIIFAQAGTLGKAFLELIMNAVDAGASLVDIEFDTDKFSVSDDGRGFRSRKEIEEWFETFGTPHEEGDAYYGRFRMGRGQIMAFAATKWKTRNFFMDVDVKGRGLDYYLKEVDEHVEGCVIEGDLYEPLLPGEVFRLAEEIKDMAKYVPIPVFVNGKTVNLLPQNEKWSDETEDAWILYRDTGSLVVYNLGVYVRHYPAHQFGTGGVLVSKKPLEVNFARNDVLVSQCEVWKRLRKHIKEHSGKLSRRKTRLTDAEREYHILRFVSGEAKFSEVKDLRLLQDTQGKFHPLKKLLTLKHFTVAPEAGNRIAETVHMRGSCFVLHPRMLDWFGVDSGGDLAVLLNKKTSLLAALEYVSFEVFKEEFKSGHIVLDKKQIKKEMGGRMPYLLKAIQDIQYRIVGWMQSSGYDPGMSRTIKVGDSDTAEAWTDGRSYIVLHRDLVKSAGKRLKGAVRLVQVLVHEYLHCESDAGSHQHDDEFYHAFHDIILSSCYSQAGEIAEDLISRYIQSLKRANKRVNRETVKHLDTEAKLKSL